MFENVGQNSTLTVTYHGEAGSEQQDEVHGQALDQREGGGEEQPHAHHSNAEVNNGD